MRAQVRIQRGKLHATPASPVASSRHLVCHAMPCLPVRPSKQTLIPIFPSRGPLWPGLVLSPATDNRRDAHAHAHARTHCGPEAAQTSAALVSPNQMMPLPSSPLYRLTCPSLPQSSPSSLPVAPFVQSRVKPSHILSLSDRLVACLPCPFNADGTLATHSIFALPDRSHHLWPCPAHLLSAPVRPAALGPSGAALTCHSVMSCTRPFGSSSPPCHLVWPPFICQLVRRSRTALAPVLLPSPIIGRRLVHACWPILSPEQGI